MNSAAPSRPAAWTAEDCLRGHLGFMSQRDNILKPGVARHELPRDDHARRTYLEEVVDVGVRPGHPSPNLHNAVGVGLQGRATRGSSFLATPGFGTKSLWDMARASRAAL
jgi:hypothetical protein